MSGVTPKRSLRISDEEWEAIQSEALASDRSATDVLLDAWRAMRDSRKVPRRVVDWQGSAIRTHLESALKHLDKLTT